MATAVPGAGQVMEGTAGPAGGAGPNPAGGFHDVVAEASDPFGRATPGGLGTIAPSPAPQPLPRLRTPGWQEPLVMLAGGLGIITVVSLMRSRRRQRRGWGTLPARRVT